MVRKGLLGPALVYTLGNAVSAGIPFILLPILARALKPEAYGQAAMFSVLVTVLGAFTGLNVHGAVSIRFFDRGSDFPRYVASCLFVLLATTALTLCIMAVTLHWLVSVLHLPGVWALIAALVSCGQFIILMQLSIWQSNGEPWKFGGLRVFQGILDAGVSLLLIVGFGAAWEGRATAMVIATSAAAGLAMYSLFHGGWVKFPARRDYVKHAITYGAPLVPHVIGGMLIMIVDRFLVGAYLGLESVGIYTVATQVGMVLGLLTDSFNKAYAPWLFGEISQSGSRMAIVRGTYGYFVAVLLAAALLGLFAPTIVGVLAGKQFGASAGIVFYVSMGFAFGGMYYMVANYVFYVGRTASLAMITLATGLLNVALCIVLLRRNGVAGAAQAFMVSQAVLFLATWRLSSVAYPMPWARGLWRRASHG